MSLIWRDEVNLDDLADAPRWFLEDVMRGEPEETAAERAGATMADVRVWSADKRFRSALKQARSGAGATTIIAVDDTATATVTTLGGDGQFTQEQVAAPRCVHGGALQICGCGSPAKTQPKGQ